MQIDKIILYNKKGEIRILPFNLGKVNIISGESKSGKTAIIGILDYCLGSNSCDISEGRIRETVSYFSIIVVFNDGEKAFIARENPNVKGVSSVGTVCLVRNVGERIPAFSELESNLNNDSLKEFLSRKIGINENVHVPDSLTREPLKANFKHSRFYCYQPQYLIADPHQLFYNQNKEFVPQSIKDTLPYFLGAINEESLSIESELTQLKRELNKLAREKRENEKIMSEGVSQGHSLLEEAREIGLIDTREKPELEEEVYKLLKEISLWEYKPLEVKSENNVTKELIDSRNTYRTELSRIEDNIKAASDFAKTTLGYNSEVKHQEVRLSTIEILGLEDSASEEKCPLCASTLESPVPTVKQINDALRQVREDLKSTRVESPRLQSYLETLKSQSESVKTELRKIENSIAAIYEENERARTLRDLNIRRGKILGRISLFLESRGTVKETSALEIKMENLKQLIEDLEKQIDSESEKDKLLSIINKINLQMSKWVDALDVEYQDAPIRFDLSRLTILVDANVKPIALPQIGSGANWVAYHLLILFSLHKHFIQNERPVPNFVVLDQPTQVYYPPEKTDELVEVGDSSDDVAVNKMFTFILDTVESLAPKFQVIITDHAYLGDNRFREAVVEIWRGGNKLIPEHWEML